MNGIQRRPTHSKARSAEPSWLDSERRKAATDPRQLNFLDLLVTPMTQPQTGREKKIESRKLALPARSTVPDVEKPA